MAIELKKMLPRILKTQFWEDFMDCISTELTNVKDEMAKKLLLFNIDEQTDIDQLIEVAKMFGYTPDLSLDDSLIHVRREVESIPYRIKKKTTYDSYEHVFKIMDYLGEVFLSYWNDNKLVRAREDWLDAVIAHGSWWEPFLFTSERDFNAFIFDIRYLDQPNLDLDEGTTWYLDQGESRLTTKHLFIELAISKLLQDANGDDFSMLFEYLEYLENAAHYTRKVTEVPHVGCQLTSFSDESGWFSSSIIHNAFFRGTRSHVEFSHKLDDPIGYWAGNDVTLSVPDPALPIENTHYQWYKITVDALTFPFYGTSCAFYDTARPRGFIGMLKRGTTDKTYFGLTTLGYTPVGAIEVDWTTDTISAVVGTLLGYEWLDADSVVVRGQSTAITGSHYLAYFNALYGGAAVGEYFYAAAADAQYQNYLTNPEDEYIGPIIKWTYNNPPTETEENTINARYSNIPTLAYELGVDQFHIRLTNVRPWFDYDTTIGSWVKCFMSYYIDANRFLDIIYDPTVQKIAVRWRDGGTASIMLSSTTYTQADFYDHDYVIDVSLDLSTSGTGGSTLWVDGVVEADTWATAIDVMTSTFNTIHMGHRNEVDFADSLIDGIAIYDGVMLQADVDADLDGKTVLFSQEFLDSWLDMRWWEMDSGEGGSIPEIQLKSAITPNYNPAQPVSDITSVVIGIGDKQYVPSRLFRKWSAPDPDVPTALDNQIAEIELDVDEQESAAGWKMIQTVFQQGKVTNELLGTGDGSNTAFAGTLNVFPVIAGTLIITYRSNPVDYQMEDDGDGNIIDVTENDLVVGSIDYETGVYSFDTIKYVPIVDEVISVVPITLFTHFTVYSPIRTSSIVLTYQIGAQPYTATDNGAGQIIGTGITTGTVNYATGEINVTFTAPTDAGSSVLLDYQHQHETPPDLDDEVLAEYETTGVSDITEAGLLNSAGDMVLYQHFPPVNLQERKYHLSLQFFIKDGDFYGGIDTINF